MGDRPGSFSRVRMSEDKVRTKYTCWSVGTIYNPRELPGVSTAGLGVDGVLQVVSEPNLTILKGKCALGPFLSILVIECQHKCLNVNLCSWMNKVQIKSKGMFLSLSTLVLYTNILV
jgi:hypothetical protein